MNKTKKSKNKLPLIIGVTLLAVFCAVGYYMLSNRSTNAAVSSQPTINYNPPSKQDVQNVNDNKQRIVQRDQDLQNQPPSGSDGKQTSKPIITYAGQYGSSVEVGGYVSVLEDGGSCTTTFTQGSVVITKRAAAVRDANSVDCPAVSVDVSQFVPKGTYSVTLSYSSAQTSGVSDSKTIEVK